MFVGKVIGHVWATIKDESFDGYKFMIVQPKNRNLEDDGEPIVALDTTQCGPGMLVYYVTSREATVPLSRPAPTDATIIGIVDSIKT